MNEKCKWHEGDSPVSYDPKVGANLAYCPECGCMLTTKTCEGCGKDFLDWEVKGGDDIMRSPSVTSAGDLMCDRCAAQWERDEEESYEEEYGY